MRCRHLSLTNFRTYRRLELDLPPGVSVLCGNNAQGKSNLLEALYMLATIKSFRTGSERELVSWHAGPDERFARISAEIERQGSTSRLDIILAEPTGGNAAKAAAATRGRSIRKRVRLNRQPRRATDALGQLNSVLFTPADVELITGSPAQRRRYLDIMLCQVDPHYVRVLSQYQRVLTQRNALLRQLRDRRLPADQLRYWTEQVVALGSELIIGRGQAIATLNSCLAAIHPRLVDDRTSLGIVYRSSVTGDCDRWPVARGQGAEVRGKAPRATGHGPRATVSAVAAQFAAQLDAQQARERRQGMTVVGPHRDDLAFTVDGVDLNRFGSRGQQRTAALAVKLAEAAMMEQRTGERPVLLLDDVLSELDPQRRLLLQEILTGDGLPVASAPSAGRDRSANRGGQVLITTTELRPFTAAFLAAATVFEVANGALRPIETDGT